MKTRVSIFVAMVWAISFFAGESRAATVTVTNLNDSGAGSLRDAISTAGVGDTIVFQPFLSGTISLSGELGISRNLNIIGPGPGTITIARSQAAGTPGFRIFTLVSGTIRISGVTVTNGLIVGPDAPSGRGPGGIGEGGGIFVGPAAIVTVDNCAVTNNRAAGGLAGMSINSQGALGGSGNGGGICNRGNLTLTNSTVSGNYATGGDGTDYGGGYGQGGGVFNGSSGFLKISNCAIYGNQAQGGSARQTAPYAGDGKGGGVCNNDEYVDDDQGTLFLTNSTIASNTTLYGLGPTHDGAAYGGGVFVTRRQLASGTQIVAVLTNCTITNNFSDGGPLPSRNGPGEAGGLDASRGQVDIINSLIAANMTRGNSNAIVSPDVLSGYGSGSIHSLGHNLISRIDGTPAGTWTGTDNTGTASTPIDPRLAPGGIKDNGGPTFSQAVLPSSVAIDMGDDSVLNSVSTDQRGIPRKLGGHVDVGAVEQDIAQPGPVFTVTTLSEHSDGIAGVYDCTLIEALDASNANPDANTIVFAPGLSGTITTNMLTPAGLSITGPVQIIGPGARTLVISGNSAARAFAISSSNVEISGVTIFDCHFSGKGAGVYNAGGVTFRACTFYANIAFNTSSGGAIWNEPGASLTTIGCTFYGNMATSVGGAIQNSSGNVTATNCTFNYNTAPVGGAINSGGGSVTLLNCTVNENEATQALNDDGGGIRNAAGVCTLANTIVANNVSGGSQTVDLGGTFTSQGYNLIGKVDGSTGLTNGVNHDKAGTVAVPLDPGLPTGTRGTPAGKVRNNGGPVDTCALLPGSPAIDAANNVNAPAVDARGYARMGPPDMGAFEFGGTIPVTLANISTRLVVESGDNALFGGFIVTGTQPKKVILRAIGPSLSVPGKLADPVMELHDSAGQVIASNDNWMDAPNRQEIIDSTVAPLDDLESAILMTLPANNAAYTAIVRGANSGTGVGLVEVYDLDRTTNSKLANISTRGLVQTGDNVMIGGFIVVGVAPLKVIVRAIGPSLPLPGALANPTLELHDGNGGVLAANDDWRSDQEAEIIATTIPPSNDLESAIVRTLNPGAYTAIVSGVNGTTGVALVEVYALQ
jgi:hypothetical protein